MLGSLPRQRGLTLRVSHRLLACKAAPSSAPPKGRPTLSHVCWASGSQHRPRHKPDVPRRGPRAAEYTRESGWPEAPGDLSETDSVRLGQWALKSDGPPPGCGHSQPLSLDSFSERLGPRLAARCSGASAVPACAVCRCEASLAHVSAQPVCRPRVALRPPHFLLLSLPFSSPPRPPPSQRPLPPACPGSPLHSAGLCGRPVPPPRPCPRGVGFFTFPSPSLSTLFPCPNPCHRSNVRPRGGLLQEAHPDFLAEHALSSL